MGYLYVYMKLLDIIFESVVDLNEGIPMSKDEFVRRSKEVHGEKYSYDNVDMSNGSQKPVNITCSTHGDFPQSPSNHLRGKGCKKCYHTGRRMSKDEFIQRAKEIHGDKYNYDNVVMGNNSVKDKININCPIHGDFPQSPNTHLSGSGCRKCQNDSLRLTRDEFIKRAKEVHKNKYGYDNVVMGDTNKDNVMITCSIHGDFPQSPSNHLNGMGCPICKESKGEKQVSIVLDEMNIEYIRNHRFIDCSFTLGGKKCKKYPFDFYLPNKNVCIEYDGAQHFNSYDRFGGDEKLLTQKQNDKLKNEYCKKMGVKLIRIGYLDMGDIRNQIEKSFKSDEMLWLSDNYPLDKGLRDGSVKV